MSSVEILYKKSPYDRSHTEVFCFTDAARSVSFYDSSVSKSA